MINSRFFNRSELLGFLALAVLRGAYHLYQGVGPGIGNALMGVVFTLVAPLPDQDKISGTPDDEELFRRNISVSLD